MNEPTGAIGATRTTAPALADSPDGQRAVPYVCPFCAEEDLRPVDRGWHCRSCLRVFSVSFHGLAPIDHQHSSARPDPQESDRR